MPDSDFFTRFGLFAVKGFLDARSCASFRSEMLSSTLSPATVVDDQTSQEIVKENVRKTFHAKVSKTTTSFVKERLVALRPRLEDHFKSAFDDCEKPQFLIYKEGDYFNPHKDGEDEEGKPEYIKKRRISVIIFLNEYAEGPVTDVYRGGALTFYGLVKDPGWEKYGFHLNPETGLMIAFRADILHGVTTVTEGTRYTIVSWFF